MRPYFSKVERIDPVGFRILERHNLKLQRPAREITLGNMIEQVAAMIVAVLSCHPVGFVLRQVCVAVTEIGVEVPFDPKLLARFVDQHIGVTGIAVHLPPVLRHTAVAHQIGYLMSALGTERPEIPLHVVIAQAIVCASLLAANEMLELQGIANEKNRGVVPHHVEIAILGIELDRESARITPGVGAAALAGDGGKAHRGFHFCAGLQEFSLGVRADVRRNLETAESAASLRVRLAFGDTLPIEIRHLLDQVVIVENDRAVRSDRQRMFIALDGNARISRCARSSWLIGHGITLGVRGSGVIRQRRVGARVPLQRVPVRHN